MQGQLQSEGIFWSTRTCRSRIPLLLQRPGGYTAASWPFGAFPSVWHLLGPLVPFQLCFFFLATLRPLGNSALSLPLCALFLAQESSWLFCTRHLPVNAPPPSWLLGDVATLSGQLLLRCLRSTSLLFRCLSDHSIPCSLFDTLRTDRHSSGQWKLTVLLACGSVISWWWHRSARETYTLGGMIRIGYLNVRSLTSKLDEVIKLLQDHELDILCLRHG